MARAPKRLTPRQIRKALGFSQVSMQRVLWCDRSVVSRLETRKGEWSIAQALRFLDWADAEIERAAERGVKFDPRQLPLWRDFARYNKKAQDYKRRVRSPWQEE